MTRQRPVPNLYGGDIAVIAENAQSARIEQKMLSRARWRPDPTRDKHAQHVPVGEQRHVASGCTGSGYHPIHPRAHFLRLLATGASIAKQQPARRPLVDLLGRYALIFAVVPLSKIEVDDRDRTETCQLAGFTRSLHRAAEDERKHLLGEHRSQ